MRQVRGSMLVVVLCCAARTAVAEERPDARLQEAQTAFDEANKLWDAGQRADAIARGEHALALRESVLGSTHPDVATCLDWLGLHFLFQKNPVRGEPLLQRALAIREAAYGRDSSSVGRALNDLADLSSAQGLYGQARPLYTRALVIQEATLGKNHPHVARTLNRLAVVHLSQRRLAKALPLLTRAFAISEQRLRQESLGFSEARLASFLQFLRADYHHLLAGQGRATALREAMRELRLTQPHPHHWAPFLAMGRETPLRLPAPHVQEARR